MFDGFATLVDDLVEWFTRFILWLSWVGATAVGAIVVLRFGGRRAAAITLVGFASFALLGLWEPSMETLALMLVAVGLSLLVGIPLGVVAGRSDRFQSAISPILDAMQIVSFVILLIMMLILGNTIAMGVRERTHEYGVLRAIGFMPKHLSAFVVVEAVLVDPDKGSDWKIPFCAVLKTRDGRIVRDDTYGDFSKWPGMH